MVVITGPSFIELVSAMREKAQNFINRMRDSTFKAIIWLSLFKGKARFGVCKKYYSLHYD